MMDYCMYYVLNSLSNSKWMDVEKSHGTKRIVILYTNSTRYGKKLTYHGKTICTN